jgi:ABC-2 type transport system ATP-binding protein
VGVINKGKLLLVDEKDAIMAKLGSTEARVSLTQALTELPEALSAYPLSIEDAGRTLVYRGGDGTGKGKREAAEVIKALVDLGIGFEGIDTKESSLEDIFVDLVEHGEAAA